ncbi:MULTISPECIES: hypothetical protein [Agrobacterium]|uniref:hypothetical protein n=1 Tax=Agrobacterium TaxID=357 RepID=UPI000A0613F3|nr:MULTISPECIES: hypothetical protein [Agrobacterium]MEA1844772.1 hypothetical protein [Agrobacterium tumefaciens]QKX00545.1 hypothetical protein GSF67_25615 [Agrobacterium sp. CGMCC 11546]UXT84870.1 hypothetical protein FY131_25870 [Agrobacterium tumefaciens]
MINKLAIAAFSLIAASSAASATSMLSEAASPIAKITQGHGKPGDTATSVSDPDVTFRVLDSGKVERTNKRFGTAAIVDPLAEFRTGRRNR